MSTTRNCPPIRNAAALAARPVPRYTSYPTAPNFSGGLTPEEATGWLAALPPGADTSLYLHVPYCTDLCAYCGCHTKATHRVAPVMAYGATLAREVRLVRDLIGHRLPVRAIHWGGGTPSLLPAESFAEIVANLRHAFEIAPDAEHAIELDPRTVTASLARRLAAAGINRASLGVQDLDATVQRAIGRPQPLEAVADAVRHLRAAGVEAINFDLIFGLPHQTVESVRRTADAVATLAPSRLSVFGYAHVPWMKANQKRIDEAALPGAGARLALESAIRERLLAAGYAAVGLDHFARPDDPLALAAEAGRLHRNFQGYTTDDAEILLGFGASSISRLPQGYLQNLPAVDGWRRLVEAGLPPVARGHGFDADDRLRAAIIERLMCDFSVDLSVVAPAHGADPATLMPDLDALAPLAREGLARIDGWRITVPVPAQGFVRLVAATFDAYRSAGRGRHAMAV